MEDYNPFKKTAIVRNKLSKPMQVLLKKELLQGSIVDYACGYGEDVKILQSNGFNIKGYDKYNPNNADNELLNRHYNTLTCNYMFNVIPNLQEHQELIQYIKTLADNIYICVRSDIKAIRDNWRWSEEEQGYWTTNNSFQRFYTVEMVDKYFGQVEYISNNSSFKLFKLNK